MVRKIHGLRWARMLEGKPPFHVATRSVGVKNVGIRYEKELARGLGARFRHGVWWEFMDRTGRGWCQTDFFGMATGWTVLLESKLTWTEEAEEQLFDLYIPVVACAMDVAPKRVLPIVVCKYLTKETERPIWDNLRDAIHQSMEGVGKGCVVWHHFGGVPKLWEMVHGQEAKLANA